ncbi:Hypothetical predicted protein [Cloeon dipterum]|uniref:Uncharacterized protein n=1 Tax=Cloeon dipterum TaxID=197152 RepID=A0A8S1DKU5_9INSE|nr:Hypothetical predicted protein [Cloeon dipterum]
MSSRRCDGVDKRQLEQFLQEIARFRAEERSQQRAWRSLGDSIRRNQALLASRNVTLVPILESFDSEDEEEDEEEEDAYSTVAEDELSGESNAESGDEEAQDLEEYSRLLHEFAEAKDEEEEWIRDVELQLMGKVRDSLINLMACQLVVKQQEQKQEQGSSSRVEVKQQRRSSVQDAVLESRRARAEEIRRQSEKAAKKVQRAKARQLKAGRALVRALRQRRQVKKEENNLKKGKKRADWADLKKDAERELQRHLASLVEQVHI